LIQFPGHLKDEHVKVELSAEICTVAAAAKSKGARLDPCSKIMTDQNFSREMERMHQILFANLVPVQAKLVMEVSVKMEVNMLQR